MAMGAADVIPGVSWGTIAFISGIYDQLVTSIAHIDKQLWSHIIARQRKKARIYMQGFFLIQLFGGIITSIVLLVHTMTYLLEYFPLYVFSFFSGLIVASIVLIIYQHLPRCPSRKLLFLLTWGIVAGYVLTSNISLTVSSNPSLLSLFVAGACASIAMILPGISWSYILLLMGKYQFILATVNQQIDHVMQAISTKNIGLMLQYESLVLLVFICGIITWLVGFAKILHRLLHHHHATTLTILVGFMIWSLHTIWPWSQPMDMTTLWTTVGLALLGVGIIYGIYILSTIKKTTS